MTTTQMLDCQWRAEYGSRTRLRGLGSRCTTDVLIPLMKEMKVDFSRWSRYPDSNRGPTHYECVALPTEPYRLVSMLKT